MRVLIDTNVFLRLATTPEDVPQTQRDAIDNAQSRHLSVASAWEIAVKISVGKLPLPGRAADYVRERVGKMRMSLLPVELAHIDMLQDLTMHHRDPFDRLIIAQALTEGFAVATLDGKFKDYGVNLI